MAAWRDLRDKTVAAVVVLGFAGLCWAWLGKMIWDMNAMPPSSMPMDGMVMNPSVSIGYAVWLIIMWMVMMAAMMLPSAAPMTLVYASFEGVGNRPSTGSVLAFVGGYSSAWASFSIAAGLLQFALERVALVSPATMMLKNEAVAGAVLIAAGIYQWTPIKNACLRRCRTPIGFMMTEWRDGATGALTMGWRHGMFCVGCCWALMALLFVGGVMNPLWIIALALIVLAEKTLPFGGLSGRILGAGLAMAGLWFMFF